MGSVVALRSAGAGEDWFDSPEALDAERAQGRELPTKESRRSDLGERALLGVMLDVPVVIPEVAAILNADAFVGVGHGALFTALVETHRATGGVDLETVLAHLRASGAYGPLGGGQGLLDLAEHCATLHSEAVPTARRLAEYASARKLELIGTALYRAARDWSRPVASVRQDALKALGEVRLGGALPGALGADLEAFYAALAQAQESTGPAGLRLGLRDLDAVTGGLSGLTVVGARPGLGKSTLALQGSLHVAATQGPVYYASLEMPRQDLVRWALAHLGQLDARSLRTGALSPEELTRMDRAARRLASLPLVVEDRGPMTVAQIASAASELQRRQGLALVVVDTLRKVKPTRQHRERRDAVSEIVGELQELTKPSSLGVPVLLLAHIGRDVGKGGTLYRRPRIEDLSESSAIEAEASTVLLLHNEHHYPTQKHETPPPADVVEVCAAKQRHDARGACLKLRHMGPFITFADLDPEADYDWSDAGGGG